MAKALTTDENPLAFFESVYAGYQQAEQAAGGAIEKHFALGGHVARLRFAGAALIPIITPALEHLAVMGTDTPAELTIYLWDSASTGIQPPVSPWVLTGAAQRGGIIRQGDNDCTIFVPTGSGLLIAYHRPSQAAVVWTRTAHEVPIYEYAAPLRPLWHVWLRQWGQHLAHVGAIGTTQGGVLLAGVGGSGKSSTALLCISAGWHYCGDDFCSITVQTPFQFQVYSLYNTARINAQFAQKLARVSDLTRNAAIDDQGKAVVFLHRHFPQQIARNFPIRAILAARVTGNSETQLKPITPGAALKALAPSTVFHLPAGRSEDFQAMAELVQRVPCYQLELGTDLSQVPVVIQDFLAR